MIAIALSGGVDSSVAALLAREARASAAGLVAIHLHLWEPEGGEAETSCCTPESARIARRTAEILGIPFYTFNLADIFRKKVVRPFVEAYARGETPNPCVTCNRTVKFGALAAAAAKLGAEGLVTGHYARAEGGRLHRGRDAARDQSYFLYGIPLALKGRLDFPLGHLHKDEVRALAERKGLPAAGRPDSQEVCFVPAQGYRSFFEKQALGSRTGELVAAGGRSLGRHAGIHLYTRGQRAGIPGSAEPLYVLSSDAASGEVRVGPEKDLYDGVLELEGLRGWGLDSLADDGAGLSVQARYRAEPLACRVFRKGRTARVELESPVRAAAPGQSAVFYRGDEMLGGGLVRRAAALR